MKKSQIIISILCYIIFVVMWFCIGFAGIMFLCLDFDDIMPIVIKVIFVILALILVVSPIYIKISHPKRAYTVIILTIIYVLTVLFAYYGFCEYYSGFSKEKWIGCDEKKRYRMIDSLESQYTLKGMNGDEIIGLLGEPNHAQAGYNTEKILNQYFYEYYVGNAMIDIVIYRVVFENGIVIKTELLYT